ncbi:MAG: indolepyruvate oxidoreductase subunit beta [Pseudomonadota bacterium]
MILSVDPFNIIIGGVGGQGNVLASMILGRMLVSQGGIITIGETYGASQRGGSVMSHLRVSTIDQFSPLIPEGKGHLLVALEPIEGLRMLGQYGNPDLLTVVNTRPIHPLDVLSGKVSYPDLPIVLSKIRELSRQVWALNATEIALRMGDPIFANMIMLGALSTLEILPVGRAIFKKIIEDLLPPERLAVNLEAFDRGREAVQELV